MDQLEINLLFEINKPYHHQFSNVGKINNFVQTVHILKTVFEDKNEHYWDENVGISYQFELNESQSDAVYAKTHFLLRPIGLCFSLFKFQSLMRFLHATSTKLKSWHLSVTGGYNKEQAFYWNGGSRSIKSRNQVHPRKKCTEATWFHNKIPNEKWRISCI